MDSGEPLSLYVEIGILVFCIIFSGVFSASETTLTSLSEVKCRRLYESGGARARRLKLWLNFPNRTLTTILIGNNLVNVLGSAVATGISLRIFGSLGIGVATGVMTFVILVCGEIIPKTYAKHNSEKLAVPVINFLYFIYVVLFPLVFVMTRFATRVIGAVGAKAHSKGPIMTSEEIEYIISTSREDGVIEEEKTEMLSSIFEFSDTLVKEVMIPRPHIFALSADLPLTTVVDRIIDAGFSRIPVYRDDLDNIIGILYAKDLLQIIRSGSMNEEFNIEAFLRPPVYIPEMKKVDALFRELQNSHIHMALVVDEYGALSGIVSMEDLLEEIVGEIRDEYDSKEKDLIHPVAEGIWSVDPRINIDDFKYYFKIENFEHPLEADGEFDSVGGLLCAMEDGLPAKGSTFTYSRYIFTVDDVDERRLKKLSLHKRQSAEEADAAQSREEVRQAEQDNLVEPEAAPVESEVRP
ncbi:hemolysin family protein [Desulfurispira natronophila]|uniref:CBS domain containing-hemolysin-like protein n=1 Tax=Desulfurispira natronophila TaxID=682562 RepID=A0A7W8DGY1_9BACT|nr:hemolysin family protein [Desulfurispira natronophila]MBB5021708.1 CBS domain containing-hemolysin-like protein [Desulfurispira natronophila]